MQDWGVSDIAILSDFSRSDPQLRLSFFCGDTGGPDHHSLEHWARNAFVVATSSRRAPTIVDIKHERHRPQPEARKTIDKSNNLCVYEQRWALV